MEQLCQMAYYGQEICEEVWFTDTCSFETVWKKYDPYEPMVILQLRTLYMRKESVCPGFWSFMKDVFPNCEIVFYE